MQHLVKMTEKEGYDFEFFYINNEHSFCMVKNQ